VVSSALAQPAVLPVHCDKHQVAGRQADHLAPLAKQSVTVHHAQRDKTKTGDGSKQYRQFPVFQITRYDCEERESPNSRGQIHMRFMRLEKLQTENREERNHKGHSQAMHKANRRGDDSKIVHHNCCIQNIGVDDGFGSLRLSGVSWRVVLAATVLMLGRLVF